jgi:hypothetical protein
LLFINYMVLLFSTIVKYFVEKKNDDRVQETVSAISGTIPRQNGKPYGKAAIGEAFVAPRSADPLACAWGACLL